MTAQFNRTLPLITAMVLPLASASGQNQLTDITIFSADDTGNWTSPDIYETRSTRTMTFGFKVGLSVARS
jgi:hypothetical protein